MKEFMLYIRNDGSPLSEATELEFLRNCESYIEDLKSNGKLIGAQPLAHEGIMVSNSGGDWNEAAYNDSFDSNAGYYHILANDMNDAVAIAKKNPEFIFRKNARIEVRPIKTEEESTGYTYPSEGK